MSCDFRVREGGGGDTPEMSFSSIRTITITLEIAELR